MEGGGCSLPSMCVCHVITRDKNRTIVKVLFPQHIFDYYIIYVVQHFREHQKCVLFIMNMKDILTIKICDNKVFFYFRCLHVIWDAVILQLKEYADISTVR